MMQNKVEVLLYVISVWTCALCYCVSNEKPALLFWRTNAWVWAHTEIDEHDEYSIDKEADYCDDMTEGLSLVVWPFIAVQKASKEEEWRRTNIFHIQVSCHGKLCTMIIDGGISLNVACKSLLTSLD